MSSASVVVPRRVAVRRVQTRFRLVGGGVLAVLLALLAIVLSLNAYETTLSQFRSIALNNSAKVDAAEQSLQYVASMAANAATFVITAADSSSHWAAQDAVHSDFQKFRDQMFAVRNTLSGAQEQDIYLNIEYFSYDQFWRHISNLLTAEQNGDKATATSEYLVADNYLQNQIVRYLQQLEALNFQAMEATQQSAATTIWTQALILGFFTLVLALGLTFLSFWLRGKVRRYLTPGIDVALVVAWVLALAMLIELWQAPQQLNRMVEDAYLSVSASSRVLAVANQGNRDESGSIIDPSHVSYWQQEFDGYKNSVELRICGIKDCMSHSFLSVNDNSQIDPQMLNQARLVSVQLDPTQGQTFKAIGGIAPLIANVTFDGEAQALEQARLAWLDYLTINTKLRQLVDPKNKDYSLDDAITLETGTEPGQSTEAFSRFTTAMEQERTINRTVFDEIWNTENNVLPAHRLLYGLVGYVLLIILVGAGVYHRFREL
ncbi:MAG: hypothetical protein ABI947_28570 [Chloroflexota bacterium]